MTQLLLQVMAWAKQTHLRPTLSFLPLSKTYSVALRVSTEFPYFCAVLTSSDLTAIVSAYYLGTSLFPEAKTWRLAADIFNDVSIVFDTLSPHLGSLELTYQYPFVYHGNGSSLRIASLCLSGAFRALCGVVAGGSKTALTVHFATSGRIPGDIGDLNAKDASKETVLALLGMLVSLYHLCGRPRRIRW